jgi:hypothetical protein
LVEPDDDGVEDTDLTQRDVDADVRAEARRMVEDLMRFALAFGVRRTVHTRQSVCGDRLDFPCGHWGSAGLKD